MKFSEKGQSDIELRWKCQRGVKTPGFNLASDCNKIKLQQISQTPRYNTSIRIVYSTAIRELIITNGPGRADLMRSSDFALSMRKIVRSFDVVYYLSGSIFFTSKWWWGGAIFVMSTYLRSSFSIGTRRESARSTWGWESRQRRSSCKRETASAIA